MNKNKCEFNRNSIIFLVYVLNHRNFSKHKKVEIIYKTNTPTIIAGVRSLLGMIMYSVNLNFHEV